jgi:di/tricarboxylate transporter
MLTSDMAMVLAILALTIYLFAFEVVRVDLAALMILVIIGLLGLVPSDDLFRGFSSNAVISIIAIMIMGAGLDRTGIMSELAGYVLKVGGATERRIVPIISGVVGVISAFMQNIGAAALFLPVVSRISTRTGISMSRLLMPMGFCAILGGTLTMVGSSPLILLNDLIASSNAGLPDGMMPMESFGLFAVTPVGIALLAMGILYFVVGGRYVLPDIKGDIPDPGSTARYFEDVYGIKGDVFEAEVPLDCPLVGMTIGEAEAQVGMPRIIGVSSHDAVTVEPSRDELIWVGSVCAFLGTESEIRHFKSTYKLDVRSDLNTFVNALNPTRAGISEVVIPPNSNFIGKTIGDIGLRRRYGVSALAVYRGDATLRDDMRAVELRAGDTVVLHSTWDDLHELSRNRDFVIVTDYPHEVTRPHKVLHALMFFALALALVLFSSYQLSTCLLVGAVGMIVSGVLTVDESYRAVSWQTVFLLASLIPLGFAMQMTGTAAWVAQEVLAVIGDVPIWVLQTVVAVLSTAFTLLMSNVGATVLLVPLAVNIAIAKQADPAVFALIVALATSNSFLIPTHQVNALIMGPAGYRVADFMRAGGVMTLLFLVVMLVTVNLAF